MRVPFYTRGWWLQSLGGSPPVPKRPSSLRWDKDVLEQKPAFSLPAALSTPRPKARPIAQTSRKGVVDAPRYRMKPSTALRPLTLQQDPFKSAAIIQALVVRRARQMLERKQVGSFAFAEANPC